MGCCFKKNKTEDQEEDDSLLTNTEEGSLSASTLSVDSRMGTQNGEMIFKHNQSGGKVTLKDFEFYKVL